MTLDERHTRKIGEEAGIKDVHGRPRVLYTAIDGDHVTLADGRGWYVTMPSNVAAQLGIYLQSSAIEVDQQQGRRS